MRVADHPAQRTWEREARRREKTITELLDEHARERPDAIAFTFLPDGENVQCELTFGELSRQARTIASRLGEFTGQRAVLVYPSNAEFVAALFGCLYAGVVAVHAPLVASTPERTLSRVEVVAGKSDPSLVLATQEVAGQQELFVAAHSPLRRLPWYASDSLEREAVGDEEAPLPSPKLDKLALIQFTSGTTGTARGIPLRFDHLTRQSCGSHASIASDENSVTVGWTPLFHDMGLFLTVFEPVYTGHRSVVLFPLAFLARPARWLEAISRFRGTISGGPNFAYDLCARRVSDEERERLDLSSWQVAFVGGEQVRPATLERFARAFTEAGFDPDALCPSYGLAEATCAVTGVPIGSGAGIRRFDREQLRNRTAVEVPHGQPIASVGYAYGEQRLIIVDPQTRRECSPQVVGEVWLRSRSVAEGYWNEQKASAETFRAQLSGSAEGGFLRTGDLGFKLGEELFIVGRIKELIIIRGRNIFPQDIETTVQESHPALRPGCGAAFAIDTGEGERLVVAQEVRSGADAGPDEIKQAISRAIAAEHEVETDAIVLLPPRSIPKTSSGKIQRKLCRVRFMEGGWPVSARVGG